MKSLNVSFNVDGLKNAIGSGLGSGQVWGGMLIDTAVPVSLTTTDIRAIVKNFYCKLT